MDTLELHLSRRKFQPRRGVVAPRILHLFVRHLEGTPAVFAAVSILAEAFVIMPAFLGIRNTVRWSDGSVARPNWARAQFTLNQYNLT